MMVRWKGYKNEAYHITLYRHNTGGNRRKKKPFRFFFEILFRRPLMSCCCYYITDKTCVSTFFVCVGLGWGYWCPSLGKGRRLTLKKIFPPFLFSSETTYVSFSSSCVVQQQRQDSNLLSRVVGTSQRFLENWGEESGGRMGRKSDRVARQRSRHFIYSTLADSLRFFKKGIEKKNHFPNYFWRHFWKTKKFIPTEKNDAP